MAKSSAQTSANAGMAAAATSTLLGNGVNRGASEPGRARLEVRKNLEGCSRTLCILQLAWCATAGVEQLVPGSFVRAAPNLPHRMCARGLTAAQPGRRRRRPRGPSRSGCSGPPLRPRRKCAPARQRRPRWCRSRPLAASRASRRTSRCVARLRCWSLRRGWAPTQAHLAWTLVSDGLNNRAWQRAGIQLTPHLRRQAERRAVPWRRQQRQQCLSGPC